MSFRVLVVDNDPEMLSLLRQHLENDGRVVTAVPSGDDAVKALEHQPMITVHVYPGRDHAFARPGGEHYHAADAALADQRSMAFFKAYL